MSTKKRMVSHYKSLFEICRYGLHHSILQTFIFMLLCITLCLLSDDSISSYAENFPETPKLFVLKFEVVY